MSILRGQIPTSLCQFQAYALRKNCIHLNECLLSDTTGLQTPTFKDTVPYHWSKTACFESAKSEPLVVVEKHFKDEESSHCTYAIRQTRFLTSYTNYTNMVVAVQVLMIVTSSSNLRFLDYGGTYYIYGKRGRYLPKISGKSSLWPRCLRWSKFVIF